MYEIHGLHLTLCPTPPLAGLTAVCLPALLLQLITCVPLAEDRRFSVYISVLQTSARRSERLSK